METKPYLTDTGELIIPSSAPEQYKWWAGGQSVEETLTELEAPEEVIAIYIDQLKGHKMG